MLGESVKPTIVISGINMMDGGALSIITECLRFLDKKLSSRYSIIALVHKKEIFNTTNITYIEFPDSKSTWFKRIKYEYFDFPKLSEEIKPVLWFSLHDISPRVAATVKAVYCHNPAPFYKPRFNTLFLEPKLILFSAFYKYLYRINIDKNEYVVVQQQWMRDKFMELFPVQQVVVAPPEVKNNVITEIKSDTHLTSADSDNFIFFYPSFPRIFKNFEVLFEASQILQQHQKTNFRIRVTLTGKENKYATHLFNKYKEDPFIEWCGLLPRHEVYKNYQEADCLIFSSKLETWGLPITEFRDFNKPMLLADLPYARETARGVDKKVFFDPDAAVDLAKAMEGIMQNSIVFDSSESSADSSSALQANNWQELFNILLPTNE